MPMRSASSISSGWRRNSSSCVEFWRGVVVDQMASRIPHLPGSPRRLAAALRHAPRLRACRQSATRPPPSARGREAGDNSILRRMTPGLKASAIFHRPEPQNPLKPGDRAALVTLAEVVEAGHLDDVGDVNQAADHSKRKPTCDGEGDPVLQAAPWSHGAATIDESEQ